jgi:hypothetical protein
VREVVGRLAVAVFLVLTLGGCGFVHAGQAGKSKPNGFVLRGYASVAGAAAGSAGTACVSPPTVHDVAPSTPVQVTDPAGKALASGQLGAGVLAVDSSVYRCNFPFEIRAVPGGEDQYVITVGARPAVTFPATELREDKPAVIDVGAS